MISWRACQADSAVSAATGAQSSRSAGDREAKFNPVPRTMSPLRPDRSRRRIGGGPACEAMTTATTPYAAAATTLAERYVMGSRPMCRPPYASLPHGKPDARHTWKDETPSKRSPVVSDQGRRRDPPTDRSVGEGQRPAGAGVQGADRRAEAGPTCWRTYRRSGQPWSRRETAGVARGAASRRAARRRQVAFHGGRVCAVRRVARGAVTLDGEGGLPASRRPGQ